MVRGLLRELRQIEFPQDIRREKEGFQQTFQKLEALNKSLKGVSKQGVELSGLNSRWDELEEKCEAFNLRVEEQMEHLRGQMDGRIQEMQALFSSPLHPSIRNPPSPGSSLLLPHHSPPRS